MEPSAIGVPSLWVAGAQDATYVGRMRDEASRAEGSFVAIAECGHNVVLRRPEQLADTIRQWTMG